MWVLFRVVFRWPDGRAAVVPQWDGSMGTAGFACNGLAAACACVGIDSRFVIGFNVNF